MLNSFIWPIDKTLLGDTTPGQCVSWNDGNEEVLCIPQRIRIHYISAEGQEPPNQCPEYDIKPSDGVVPAFEI